MSKVSNKVYRFFFSLLLLINSKRVKTFLMFKNQILLSYHYEWRIAHDCNQYLRIVRHIISTTTFYLITPSEYKIMPFWFGKLMQINNTNLFFQ